MFSKPDLENEINEFVEGLYESVLHRRPDEAGLRNWVNAIRSGNRKPHQIVASFVGSNEREAKERAKHGIARRDIDHAYHAPSLSASAQMPKRVALIGSCLFDSWAGIFSKYCAVDHITLNNVPQLPPSPPHDPKEYDFQVVQLPLRSILPERSYLGLNPLDPKSYEELFEAARRRMLSILEQNLAWNRNHGMLTFVCNIFTPQRNPLGRFAPRYDLRNLAYFIEQLNVALHQRIAEYTNAYILDIDGLSAIYGKKYHQDDLLSLSVHHGLFNDYDFYHDSHRIEPVKKATELHEARTREFIESVWQEALAMYRTVRGYDAIKLVIMDLDDSLWRGIAAEGALDTFGGAVGEGWPAGVIEALQFVKKRGILLAIASKNDEARIRELWQKMTAGRIALEDFAVIKINWKPKVENIGEILREANLLPKNVLFVDDNPVERASVKRAFPEIRVLGSNPYSVRQTLLWAPELQGISITEESSRRTQMIQAQVKRESDKETMSRDEFLKSLSLRMKFLSIRDVSHPRFDRAFELLNKTNQFNTTGKRWTHAEVVALFAQGGEFQTFEVDDIYSNYGMVGVVVIENTTIAQWAMSCRVLGLDIETAAVREVVHALASRGAQTVNAEVVETASNYICRDLYAQCGFQFDGTKWSVKIDDLHVSTGAHIAIEHTA